MLYAWRVNGQIASNTDITEKGISTEANEDGGNFTSQIIIPATEENNNTEVKCVSTSGTVAATFRIQGREQQAKLNGL